MGPVPEHVAPIGLLTGFGNEAGIEGDDAFTVGPDRGVDQLPVEGDGIKGLGELSRIGLLRQGTVAAQIAKVDFAAERQDGSKQIQKELSLRFADRPAIEYLFCQIHGAVFSDYEVSLTWRSKIPSSENGTFLSKSVRTID